VAGWRLSVPSELKDFYLNNGVMLMDRRTAKRLLTSDRNEIGGDLAQTLVTESLSGLKGSKLFGVKMVFTMKINLVADGVVYT
jgi:hypothetical protein